MNYFNNHRCGCPCRPQMPAPPCVNTNCGCEGTIIPPPRPIIPQPLPMPPVRPRTLPAYTMQQNSGGNYSSTQRNTGTADTMQPCQTGIQPSQTNMQPSQANIQPSQTNIQPSQTNMQPSQANIQPSQTNIQSSQANIQPSQAGIGMPTAQAYMPSEFLNTACGANCPINSGENIDQMPIGMGYVPWQKWGQTYPMQQGFSRGTIFPDLDLPFVMGRCR